jgi:aquaporin Z
VNPSLARRSLAEAVGTAILVGLGTGAIVAGARAGGAGVTALSVAWFAAVALPVLLFARVSGAHLNPAVTLAMVLARRLPRAEGFAYVLAQVVGAFAGSAGVAVSLGTFAHLGANLPRPGTLPLVLLLEFAFTSALVVSVLYLTRPGPRPTRWELLLPAAVVAVATFVLATEVGTCSLNPARSLAPAVLSGDLSDLWAYLLVTPAAAIAPALLVRVRAGAAPDASADGGPGAVPGAHPPKPSSGRE